MKLHRLLSFASVAAFALALLPAPAAALDVPHDTLECNTCHIAHSGGGGSGDFLTKDPAGINSLCQSCHYAGGPATEVDTHQSSTALGEDFDFSLTCNNCHDPHTQHQTFGKFIKAEIVTPNSGTKTVVLDAATGPNSFADGDTTYDGVCEVCHTQTKFHKNDGSGTSHNAGNDCRTCHSHNDSSADNLGFRSSGGSCTDCHGGVANQRRVVTNDFAATRSSGHVNRDLSTNPLNEFDCVVCHLEGNLDGSFNSTYHNTDLAVNLRDLDDASNVSWKWQDPDTIDNTPNSASCGTPNQRTQTTMFCIRCHDGDGATYTTGGTDLFTALANNGDPTTRSKTDPFGAGSNLGTLPPDVNQQFDPTNFSTHSLSCRTGGGATCDADCDPGLHNEQSSGACVADQTCGAGSCSNQEVCDDTHGVIVCQCPPNFGGPNCGTCAPGYSGYPNCTVDACTVDGASCANGHGTCATTSGSTAFEQVAMSDAGGTGWTASTAVAGYNGGSMHHNNNAGGSFSLSFSTLGSGLTYYVWIAGSRTNNTGGKGKPSTLTLSSNIDGTGLTGLTYDTDDAFQWLSAGTITLNSGGHTATFSCTADGTWSCAVDGLFLTTDSAVDPNSDIAGLLPYDTANWDAASLDDYSPPLPPGFYCACSTGYTGADCEICDTGYHMENGACVADGSGVCGGVTCSGQGTCFVTSSDTALCDCNGTYYGSSPTSCDLCDAAGPGWQSGQKSPYTPGIQTAAFANSWTENHTTECFDCHMPGNTGAAQPYSNNAHGSQNTTFMLDSAAGTDVSISPVSASGNASNIVCFTCHSGTTYASDDTASRYPEHDKSAHQDETHNWFGAPGGGNTQINCFNCHAGVGRGSIHGEADTMTDDGGNGTFNSILFINGAALDWWSNTGGSVSCSSRKNTNTWNLGCTQHTSQSYTRNY